MRRVYAKYSPKEAFKLETALKKAIENNQRRQLMSKIVEKYGPEPAADESLDESTLIFTEPPLRPTGIIPASSLRLSSSTLPSVSQKKPEDQRLDSVSAVPARAQALLHQMNPYAATSSVDDDALRRLKDAQPSDINQLRLVLR